MTFLSHLSAAAGLDRLPGAKRFLKSSLYRLRDPLARGVRLELGGESVRVPSRFARAPWTHYEPAATRRVAQWVHAHPDAAVIDVGCSVALYSLLAISLSPRAEAWAIDSDLVSLQASRWLLRHAGAERLHVIHGYAGETPTVELSAPEAAAVTAGRLAAANVPAEPSLASYICLDAQAENAIPVHRLDRLFAAADRRRSWLVKIDVEGAEAIVLRGAIDLLDRARPQLLVSVHPPALRGYGLTPDDIRAWLAARGYAIAVDIEPHEEHWWCTPAA